MGVSEKKVGSTGPKFPIFTLGGRFFGEIFWSLTVGKILMVLLNAIWEAFRYVLHLYATQEIKLKNFGREETSYIV